jgi:hypothetical protein
MCLLNMSTIGTTDCVMLYRLVNAYYEVKLKKKHRYIILCRSWINMISSSESCVEIGSVFIFKTAEGHKQGNVRYTQTQYFSSFGGWVKKMAYLIGLSRQNSKSCEYLNSSEG